MAYVKTLFLIRIFISLGDHQLIQEIKENLLKLIISQVPRTKIFSQMRKSDQKQYLNHLHNRICLLKLKSLLHRIKYQTLVDQQPQQ